MNSWTTMTEQDSGFAEVLATKKTGRPFGYRLQGSSAGPQLVVAAAHPKTEAVFERILRIPTLPWMRGTMVLIKLDALDDLFADLGLLDPLGQVDRTIMLPWADTKAARDRQLRHNYHLILRACTELGMISGRGVSYPIASREN
ncbi:hypothetical protein [Loktanella sp. S4079]|uniref:hypothetical protein n=1 Tax=Loktanella sp. S4079 TaxID=579483 RepID=UPI000A4A8C33|nr:hypothetical protein [Loktanella sp. S4079]